MPPTPTVSNPRQLAVPDAYHVAFYWESFPFGRFNLDPVSQKPHAFFSFFLCPSLPGV